MKRELVADAGVLLIAAIWGFAFVVVKSSLDHIPAAYMLAFRFTIASLAFIIIFFKKLKGINRTTLIRGAVTGIFLFTAYLSQTYGCNYTTAGKNAFITAFYTIMVPFINYMIFRKKPDMFALAAAPIAMAGIGLLSLNGEGGLNIGDILTFVCSFLFAFQIVFIDHYVEMGEDPVLLAILQVIVSAILSCITAPFLEGPFPMEVFAPDMIRGMLYLGLLSTMVCELLQNICQKYTHPTSCAVLMSMESVFGMLSSVVFLNEIVSLKMFIGCVIMFIAVIIVTVKPFGNRLTGHKIKNDENLRGGDL